MKKLLITIVAIVAGLLVVAIGQARPTAVKTVTVAMHDPGCHWFYAGGGPNHRKYTRTLTRSGPVSLLNLDEAALKVAGPGGTKLDRVGRRVLLKAKGVYTITMVGQAPDDNTLKLVVT